MRKKRNRNIVKSIQDKKEQLALGPGEPIYLIYLTVDKSDT